MSLAFEHRQVFKQTNGHYTHWTPDVDKRHRELWETGASCAEIAKTLNMEFGLQLTRNAVIGRSNRINLPPRVISRRMSPEMRAGVLAARRERKRLAYKDYYSRNRDQILARDHIRYVARRDATNILDMEIPIEQRRTILTVADGECRFSVGDPRKPDFFLCGAPVEKDKPYCTAHCARAYNWNYQRPADA